MMRDASMGAAALPALWGCGFLFPARDALADGWTRVLGRFVPKICRETPCNSM